MPGDMIAEVAGGLLKSLLRLLGDVLLPVLRLAAEFVAEAIIERLIKGTGSLICRRFTPDVDEDGWLVTSVGVAFWIIVLGSAWAVYQY